MRTYISLVLVAIVLFNCTERVELFSDARPTLVIDGSITNELGPHAIRISFSEVFNKIRDYSGVNQANVIVTDDLGNEERLTHSGRGIYHSSESFRGEIGRSYQLKIELSSSYNSKIDYL